MFITQRQRMYMAEGAGGFNVNSSADLSKLLDGIDDPNPAPAPAPQDPPAGTPPAPAPDPAPTDPPAPVADPVPPVADPSDPPAPTLDPKAGAAFAAMRTENKKLLGILQNIGKALEINAANDAELLTKLSDDAVTKISQKSNVPKEMLMEFDTMKTQLAQQNAERLHETNLTQLQSIVLDYQLTREEVTQFAAMLESSTGKAWNQQDDIRGAFLRMNEKLVRDRSAQIASAQFQQQKIDEKINAANQHSSKANPGGKTGDKTNFVINDSKGLTDILKTMKV